MARKFQNLTNTECAEVYPHILKNHKELFESAEILAQNNKFGPAISILILSAEELVKASFFFLKAQGLHLHRIEKHDKIFYIHTTKHEGAASYQLITLIETIIQIFDKELYDNDPNRKKGQIAQNIVKGIYHALKGALNIKKNIDWWEKADDLKKRGLYVDFENEILLPQSLTYDDYREALDRVNELIANCKKMTQFVSSVSPEKKLEYISKINESLIIDKA